VGVSAKFGRVTGESAFSAVAGWREDGSADLKTDAAIASGSASFIGAMEFGGLGSLFLGEKCVFPEKHTCPFFKNLDERPCHPFLQGKFRYFELAFSGTSGQVGAKSDKIYKFGNIGIMSGGSSQIKISANHF
jgi:hypothetical protein